MIGDYEAASAELGLKLMPWQKIAGRYMVALGPNGKWLFRRVAIIVARQNGKTELLRPRILLGLRMGRRMLHTAQDRERPRETFDALADWFEAERSRRDLYGIRKILRGNGKETIQTKTGGRYTLVAPRGGARGGSVDDVFLDEVREYQDFRIDAIIRPTTTARPNPQVIYMSNAGDMDSVVLNDLRRRKDDLPSLAYLEWSADPDRDADDVAGWAEANPALGITIDTETLEDNFASMEPAVWETEHLCRWVITSQPRAVSAPAWQRLRTDVEKPQRPVMAVSMDASGKRASAVIAWQQTDGSIGVEVVADVSGDPIDTDRLGPDLKSLAAKLRVRQTAFDSMTDADLARHLLNAKAIIGREFANASENFARTVDGSRLRWSNADAITDDLEWTVRKPYGESSMGPSGPFLLTKAQPERPVTAVLAATRAVWLATAPRPAPSKVH